MRYVALFAQGNSEPVVPSADAADRAQQKAAEYLGRVRKMVKKGELSAEPEVELEAREQASRQARRGKRARPDRVEGPDEGDEDEDEEGEGDEDEDEEEEGDEEEQEDEDEDEDEDCLLYTSPSPRD